MSIKTIRNALLVASLSAALAACGGGGSNSGSQDNDPTTPRPVEPIDPPTQTPPVDADQDDSQPTPDEGAEPTPVEPMPDEGAEPTPVDPAPGDSEPQPDNGAEEPEADNSAHLQWEAPNTKTDAQCLTDLVAYRISYGLSSGVYTNTETVEAKDLTCADSGERNDCGLISTCGYTVQDLRTASWYFAVQAIDSSGNLSDYSNEGIKTIQ